MFGTLIEWFVGSSPTLESGQNTLDHVPVDVGETEVSSAETVAERLVIESHEVEDGGVEIVDGLPVLHHPVAVLVGGAVDESLLEATAGQPEAEAEGIVVPAVLALDERRPSELAREDDQGLVQETPGP